MSSFTDAELIRTRLPNPHGRPIYRVQGATGEGFTFWIGKPGSGQAVHVREGFLTDRASLLSARKRSALWALGLGGFLRWIDDSLAKSSVIHDRLREDLDYCLVDSDAIFLIAMTADRPNWYGPRWATWLLREVAFIAVRANTSRIQHNLAEPPPP